MKRSLTALQPSGLLHIGNYFGAIEPSVALQNDHDNVLFIVDYHAITVGQRPDELRRNILLATAVYLAAGVDPNKTLLFQQSRVPAHTELAWVLNCVARMGELERMTQYKDKARNRGENVSVGLFDYPVLMAADILLYDTEVVPVGEDQKQHVELARDLAERFNSQFGDTFNVPIPVVRKSGARLMGLDDPSKKMSKSSTSPKSYLSLLDEPDVARKKIMTAVTDAMGQVAVDPARPGITNLLTIFSLVTKEDVNAIAARYAGKGYKEFKEDLAEAVVSFLSPLQERIKNFRDDETELKRILDHGAAQANEIANKKMDAVRARIGVAL